MTKERSLLPMILGVSVLGVALAGLGVWIMAGYLARQVGRDVPTLRRADREAETLERVERGPLYPGAVRVEDSTGQIAIEAPARGSFQLITGEYETEDGLDEAVAYYRRYFAGRATEHIEPGSARWAWKYSRGYQFVALQEGKDHLRIRIAVLLEEQ
jgi:hypothetical protein